MILNIAKKKLIAIIISSVIGLGLVGGGIAGIVIYNTPPPEVLSVTVSGDAEFGGAKFGDGFSFSVKEEDESVEPKDWTVPVAVLTEEKSTMTYRFVIKNEGGKDSTIKLKRPTTVPVQFGLTAMSEGKALTATEGVDVLTVEAGASITVEYVLKILVCNKDIPTFNLVFELKVEEKI